MTIKDLMLKLLAIQPRFDLQRAIYPTSTGPFDGILQLDLIF